MSYLLLMKEILHDLGCMYQPQLVSRISSINSITLPSFGRCRFFRRFSWLMAPCLPQQIHGCKTNGGMCIWPNQKNHQPRTPWNKRFLLLKHHLGWGRIFGRYNLTKCVYIHMNIKHEIWTDKQKLTSPSTHQCHHLQIGHIHMGPKIGSNINIAEPEHGRFGEAIAGWETTFLLRRPPCFFRLC